MKRLAKNTMIYGIGSVLTKSVGIILLPILTRFFNSTEFGVIGILMMFSVFLNAILSFGFGTSIGIVFFNKRKVEEREEVIYTSFYGLCIISSLILLLTSIFLKRINYLLLGTDEYLVEFVALLISTAIMTISLPLLLRIQFLEKAKIYVLGNLFSAVINLFTILYFVVYLKKGVRGYFESFLITQIFTLVVFLILNRFKIKLIFKKDIFVELVRYGLPMIPSFFSLFILSQSNRYLLRWFCGLSEVGIYTIGYNIGSITQLLINAFQNSWTPYFLSFIDKQKDAFFHFADIKRYYVIFMGFITSCFFLYSKLVVMMFISNKFLESFKIIGFVALSNFFIGLYSILLPPMYFEKEVKYTSIIQVLSAMMSIVFNWILIYYFKDLGAGIGLALGYFLMFQLTWLFNQYKTKSELKNYHPLRLNHFIILYTIVILLSFFPRKLGLILESIFSCLMFCLLLLFVYLMLNKEDKRKICNLLTNLSFIRG